MSQSGYIKKYTCLYNLVRSARESNTYSFDRLGYDMVLCFKFSPKKEEIVKHLKFAGIGISNFKRYRKGVDDFGTFITLSAFRVVNDSSMLSVNARYAKEHKPWPTCPLNVTKVARGCYK